jgi:hypothetical protein
MRAAPEQALQRQVAAYLSWALAPPAWFTAFPAGGGGWTRGKILKGMGLKAGVPDIVIYYEGKAFFLELKAPKGVLSVTQKRTHDELRAAGCLVAVIRSLDDFRALVDGPWWWLRACVRETKPSIEAVRRGFIAGMPIVADSTLAPGTVELRGARSSVTITNVGSIGWPESDNLGRKRRAK